MNADIEKLRELMEQRQSLSDKGETVLLHELEAWEGAAGDFLFDRGPALLDELARLRKDKEHLLGLMRRANEEVKIEEGVPIDYYLRYNDKALFDEWCAALSTSGATEE